jgi:hypothetical protein
MKIMISQPMAGKEYDEVLREREKTVRKLEAMGHTVADTVLMVEPPDEGNVRLFYLSYSLNLMSQCDGVLFLPGWEEARGCRIEHEAAVGYDLKVFYSLDEVKEASHD